MTSAHVKSLAEYIRLARSLLVVLVVAKAYALGRALHLAGYLAMLWNSLPTALVMLRWWSCSCLSTVVSFHVKENQKNTLLRVRSSCN